MSEEIRGPLCSRPDCLELAWWEVAGPIPVLLCEEHTDERVAQNMDERWEQFGAGAYVMYLLDVLEDVRQLHRDNNPVAEEVAAHVGAFLEDELERAQLAYQLETRGPGD
jgi:hypothetical protein